MAKASEEFWDAFESGGQNTAVCVCKRTHFATGFNNCLGEDELEDLRESAREKPDQFIENSIDDSICVTPLQGGIVYGCPCESDGMVEAFLISNQESILKFFRKRAERQRRESEAAFVGLEFISAKEPAR